MNAHECGVDRVSAVRSRMDGNRMRYNYLESHEFLPAIIRIYLLAGQSDTPVEGLVRSTQAAIIILLDYSADR